MWVSDNYETITPGCGCPAFAVASGIYDEWRTNHTRWHCPHCGTRRYFSGDSEETKLAKQLKEEKKRTLAAQRKANRMEAQSLKISKSLGKLRQRVKNGVCPCCSRSFQNLRRHIETKHPGFGTGGALKLLRESLAMTQAELAEKANIPQAAYISRYERDKPVPQYAKRRIDAWVDGQSE